MTEAGRTRRGAVLSAGLAAVGAMVSLSVLAGCTLQLEAPKLELVVEPAYSTRNILIPYELRSKGGTADARWELLRYQPGSGEWTLDRSSVVSVPNGSAGILPLNDLAEGRYQLTAELLVSRGALEETAAALTRQAEFYVDFSAPSGFIALDDSQGAVDNPSPPYDPAQALDVFPRYTGSVDPDRESPVQLYARVDSTVPPSAADDPAGASIRLWDGGEPSYSRVLAIVAIDEAGNIGSYRVENYSAP